MHLQRKENNIDKSQNNTVLKKRDGDGIEPHGCNEYLNSQKKFYMIVIGSDLNSKVPLLHELLETPWIQGPQAASCQPLEQPYLIA